MTILGALLLASTSINYVLLKRLLHEYRSNLMVRLDPIGEHQYARANRLFFPRRPNENRVVLFGDSRIRLWPTPEFILDYRIINRGIGGQTSAQAIHRVYNDVIALRPKIAVVEIGINDIKAIGVLEDRYDDIIQIIKDNYSWIVDQLKGSNIHIVVFTIFPVGDVELFRRMVWSPKIDSAIKEANAFLNSLKSSQVTVVECPTELLTVEGRIKSVYSLDALHINQSAYNVLNEELRKILKRLSDH